MFLTQIQNVFTV